MLDPDIGQPETDSHATTRHLGRLTKIATCLSDQRASPIRHQTLRRRRQNRVKNPSRSVHRVFR